MSVWVDLINCLVARVKSYSSWVSSPHWKSTQIGNSCGSFWMPYSWKSRQSTGSANKKGHGRSTSGEERERERKRIPDACQFHHLSFAHTQTRQSLCEREEHSLLLMWGRRFRNLSIHTFPPLCLTVYLMIPNVFIKGIVHSKKEESVTIYSPSCRSKPEWLSFFCDNKSDFLGRIYWPFFSM